MDKNMLSDKMRLNIKNGSSGFSVGFFTGPFRTESGQTPGLPCASERPRQPEGVRVRDNGSRGAGCRAQARAPLRSSVDRPFSARSAWEAPYAPAILPLQKPTEDPEEAKNHRFGVCTNRFRPTRRASAANRR